MNDFTGAEVAVFRDSSADNYTVIHNRILRNKLPVKLSAVARMVLLHLLSLPDQGWRIDRDRLAADFTEGTSTIRKALTELARAGYYRRYRQRRPDGTFKWLWQVADRPLFLVPDPGGNEDDVSAGQTSGQNPTSGETPDDTPDDSVFPQVRPVVEIPPVVEPPVVNQPPDTFINKELTPLPLPPAVPTPAVTAGDEGGGGGSDPADLCARVAEQIVERDLPDNGWPVGRKTRERLIPLVAQALRGELTATPWPKTALVRYLTENREGARYPSAVLRGRLEDIPEPPRQARRQVPWCGSCSDEYTRMVLDAEDRPHHKCECHPGYRPADAWAEGGAP